MGFMVSDLAGLLDSKGSLKRHGGDVCKCLQIYVCVVQNHVRQAGLATWAMPELLVRQRLNFQLDATRPSDPRVICAGGNFKTPFVQSAPAEAPEQMSA